MEKTFALFLLLYSCVNVYTQSTATEHKLTSRIYRAITEARIETIDTIDLFVQDKGHTSARNIDIVRHPQFLQINSVALSQLQKVTDKVFQINIPFHDQKLHLKLVRATPTTPEFRISTSSGIHNLQGKGQHFRGIVSDDPGSLVAISVFEDEVMAMISRPQESVIVLAKMPGDSSHIIYQEDQIQGSIPFSCEALMTPGYTLPEVRKSTKRSTVGCVKVFFEASYSLYQNFEESEDKVANYVAGIFNQVSTLYANEGVNLLLSDLYIWTTPDPYNHENSTTALESFMKAPLKGSGHLRQLLDIIDNTSGGRAYVDVLCDKLLNVGYSNISPFYLTVPTYSWTVNVIAHELGHGLGSFHTQDCVWGPEHCTAIDGCAEPSPNVGCGSCPEAPIPDKGTLMSYCHTKNGIDFSLGLGDEPGDLIRSRVSQAECISSCEDSAEDVCQLAIERVDVRSTTCGNENGIMTVELSGASGTETYDIGNGPQASNRFAGLSAGKYQVIVRDGIGCSRAVDINIDSASNAPTLEAIVTNATCLGNDGEVEFIASGGTAPYSFLFENDTVSASIFNHLSPGDYEIELIDSAGCHFRKPFSIYMDPAPRVEAEIYATRCGLKNGEISLKATGGISPYSISITASDADHHIDTTIEVGRTSLLSMLSAGVYDIYLEDQQGCIDSQSVQLDSSLPLAVSLSSHPASCEKSNGSISIELRGGDGPFHFFIGDQVLTGPVADQLQSGSYTVSVIDSNQCEAMASIEVGYDTTFVAPDLPKETILCAGERIWLNTGLSDKYPIEWKRENEILEAMAPQLQVGEPGIYTATIVYNEECSLSTQSEIVLDLGPQMNAYYVDTICAGTEFIPEVLNSDFTYEWMHGPIGVQTKFEESGNYLLNVTDSLGCSQVLSFEIAVIKPVQLTIENPNILICPGDEFQLQVSGAESYQWLTDDPTLFETDIANPFIAPEKPSLYKVIGYNRCFEDTVSLNLAFYNSNKSLPKDTLLLQGSKLTLTIPGATELRWQSSLDLSCTDCSEIFVQAQAGGDIYVTYLDQNGCFRSDTLEVSIVEQSAILPKVINVITPNGDGSNDYLFFDGLGRFRRSQLRVYNQDGVLVYQDLEYKNDWQGTGKQSDPLPEGIYFYTLLLDYQEQVLKIDSDLTILRD